MFGAEDCRSGGSTDFEEFGVGGCVETIVVENCRHNDISHMDVLQRTTPDRRQFLHSSSFADSFLFILHVDKLLQIIARIWQASMTTF